MLEKQEGDQSAPGDGTVSLLAQREIEARVLGPVIEALSAAFGEEAVVALVRDSIRKLAIESGRKLAAKGCTLSHFAAVLPLWTQGGALELDLIESTAQNLSFNVTRCRYAEMYDRLGLGKLGAVLSCNRDFALVDGFNPDIRLTRTQTIMEGAPHCDFRFVDTSDRGKEGK